MGLYGVSGARTGAFIWAAGLLDDRVPTALFPRLLAELAPHVALSDVDATEMLWSGEGREHEVAFRHENYFESIRRFEVAIEDRERVVRIYCDWFAEPDQSARPVNRYKWALALLQLPVPDEAQAENLMRRALREAERQGDARLARRVSAASLNLLWSRDGRSPVRIDTFLRRAEDELALTTELLGGGDRSQAERRLDSLSERLERRISSGRVLSPRAVSGLRRLRITSDVRRSQILFNDRKPVEAAELRRTPSATSTACAPLGESRSKPGRSWRWRHCIPRRWRSRSRARSSRH